MKYIEFADRLIERQIYDEMSDRHRPRLTLRHLRALRRMRETRARKREVELSLVRKMYGGMEEDMEADTTQTGKWADKLGKTALQSIKTEDRYEQEMGAEALGRIKRGGC